jgi:hypothetical protein
MDLLKGRQSDFDLLAIVNGHERVFSLRSYAMSVGRDLRWDRAWRDRVQFTYEHESKLISNVPTVVVDSRNRMHYIHEAFDAFETGTINVGYKTSEWSHWNRTTPPELIETIDSPDCAGANPAACLSTDASGREWLHVLYHRRPLLYGSIPEACRAFWYVHNAKPLSVIDPAKGWVGESWFTDHFVDQRFALAGEGGMALIPVVDSRGRVHTIGRRKSREADSVRVCHLYGSPPGPGEDWSTTIQVIDSMPGRPREPGERRIWITRQAAVLRTESGEYLDAAWSHNVREGERIRREVHFARFEVGADRWSTPIRISPRSMGTYLGPRLCSSPDGKVHVMYHKNSARVPTARLRYVRADGDPREPSSWSHPIPVASDMRTYASAPVFVAEEDTVWVGYTSGDNDVTGVDGPTQAWFRKGYPIGGSTTSDTEWGGLVWLGSDFVVREDHTLTILSGTRIQVADSSRVDRPGFTPREVDLIVEGKIVAEGTSADSIRIEVIAAGGAGPGDWGGIRHRDP